MLYLKYGEVSLPILESYSITKSSQDITFSDLQCDFTEHTIEDLPEKYQEVKIANGTKILYFGYVDTYNFGEIREKDEELDIYFTLLSPQKIATLRTCTAIGMYQIKELLEKTILKTLVDEGFVVKELNVIDRTITVNFLCETIEYCLNNLSNKFNFWWTIDEKKNIYIKDIDFFWNDGKFKHIYDDENSIPGLQYVKPSVYSEDYANVVNFTNVRMYEDSRAEFLDNDTTKFEYSFNPLITKQISSLKNGEQVIFEMPIDLKKENMIKSASSQGKSEGTIYGLSSVFVYNDNSFCNVFVWYDRQNDKILMSDNLGFENGENKDKEFLLIKDSFFSNLITGIKYNGQKTIKNISFINSESALIWSINKFYNDKAIDDKKNKISNTGIVELTIDMKESWKTAQELREIGTSYMNKNSLKLAGQIELKTDKDVFKIGDTIRIDKKFNKLSIKGNYVVTEIKINYANNEFEYAVTCKNANMLTSFIDIFRKEDTQTTSEKTYHLYLTHYNQEEFAESHEVVQ